MDKVIQAGARVLGPVVIHFFAINIVQMMGLHADAAFRVTITAVLVLPIYLWMMKTDGYEQQKKSRFTFWNGIFVVLLALIVNATLTGVMNEVFTLLELYDKEEIMVSSAQDSLFQSSILMQIIGVGVIAPIMEEVLFRGLVYHRLKDYNKGWLSIILAAGMFAVYHGNLRQAVAAFPMAVIMILLYDRWDSILAPILFHITVNLSSILATAALTV